MKAADKNCESLAQPPARSKPWRTGSQNQNVKGSYFSAQYQRVSTRRGKNRATVAVAHSMLIAIYHVPKFGVPFRGVCFHNKKHQFVKTDAFDEFAVWIKYPLFSIVNRKRTHAPSIGYMSPSFWWR